MDIITSKIIFLAMQQPFRVQFSCSIYQILGNTIPYNLLNTFYTILLIVIYLFIKKPISRPLGWIFVSVWCTNLEILQFCHQLMI